MKTKAEIRAKLRDQVAAMSVEDKTAESRVLCERLLKDPTVTSAPSIGVYLPLRDEPDLRTMIQEFLKKGLTVALPFLKEDDSWGFFEITTLKPDTTGPWNLGFPPRGREISAKELAVILVPGRGFTQNGDRIGRGKGIYDRLLADTPTHKIGVAFSCQMVDQLPRDEHDVQMDGVVRSSRS